MPRAAVLEALAIVLRTTSWSSLWGVSVLRLLFQTLAFFFTLSVPVCSEQCSMRFQSLILSCASDTDNLVDPAQFDGYDTVAPPKPIISHEAGDFNAMQDMSTALAPYTQQVNALPLSLSPAVAKLERLGLLNESADWAVASGALYVAMWKATVEDMRSRRFISGYAWWTMYVHATGMVVVETCARQALVLLV